MPRTVNKKISWLYFGSTNTKKTHEKRPHENIARP